MCFTLSNSLSGMNVQTPQGKKNLFDEAVKLSKDGSISNKDMEALKSLAGKDTSPEAMMFIDTLEKGDGRKDFTQVAKSSKFDPSSFSISMDGKLSVKAAGNKDIILEFVDDPSAVKQVKGDIEEAKETMKNLIPVEKQAQWNKVNKQNVSEVKSFLDGIKLNPEGKAQFVQAYMTANFNHPGVDVAWGGASLQEGINAVPKDEHGRKFLDCEGFVELSQTLLGKDKTVPYAVAAGSRGDKLDHQVAIFKDGDNAFVISNNEVRRVSAKNADGTDKKPEEMINEFDSSFKNVVLDPNGAMKFDTAAYKVGDSLFPDSGEEIKLDAIHDATTMSGKMNDGNGNDFHVKVTLDEATGKYSSKSAPQTGDVFNLGNGISFKIDSPNLEGKATLADGSEIKAKMFIKADGSFEVKTKK